MNVRSELKMRQFFLQDKGRERVEQKKETTPDQEYDECFASGVYNLLLY